MLVSLHIENLAIIDHVFLEFHPGFNVLTGETGAGKSIILGALDLLMGGRASTEVIRADCERAEVEGLFEVGEGAPRQALIALDLAEEEASTLLIRRIVSREGRSRVTVNGRQVTTSMLRKLTRHLVDMSSQHAHYALLSSEEHLNMLDRFGELEERKGEYTQFFREVQRQRKEERRLEGSERDRIEREDFMRFQLGEIQDINPQVGEDDSLEELLERLRHGAALREGAADVSTSLAGNGSSSALHALNASERVLRNLVAKDSGLEPLLERLSSARIEVEDLGYEFARYGAAISMNPSELEEKEGRLAELRKCKRKYGATLQVVLDRMEELSATLSEFESAEDSLIAIRKEIEVTESLARESAAVLNEERREAGNRMARAVEAELGSLALPRCEFRVAVEVARDKTGASLLMETGMDSVHFEIAPNPGEGFKPLNRVASGGELSRILLAIKSALVESDPVETSIYDEVDAGIGGGTAERVGKKLKGSAFGRQVIAITHLAQTVAFGDKHFLVEKSETDGRTVTHVRCLSEGERAEEMARMLGGITLTRQSREHAQEMLSSSLAWTPPN